MSTIAADLASLLVTVLRPGDFFTSGTSECCLHPCGWTASGRWP